MIEILNIGLALMLCHEAGRDKEYANRNTDLQLVGTELSQPRNNGVLVSDVYPNAQLPSASRARCEKK